MSTGKTNLTSTQFAAKNSNCIDCVANQLTFSTSVEFRVCSLMKVVVLILFEVKAVSHFISHETVQVCSIQYIYENVCIKVALSV